MEIVYEDKNIIICNKPVGIASQSDKSFETDLLSSVRTYCKETDGDDYAAVINRLDKPVGGLVLFARNRKTAAQLSALSGEHSIEKYYYAIAAGEFDEKKGQYDDYILKDSKSNISSIVDRSINGSKSAVLLYEVLEMKEIDGAKYSLVKIRLITGRHHQIRAQLAFHGHALYGDIKYNKNFTQKRGVSPALFAYRIAFNNPVGVDRIAVEACPKGSVWEFEYFL